MYNSSEIPIKPNQKYKTTASFIGVEGKKYSAYFVVIILDSNKKEILRRIRWLNDFSGKPKEYMIIFTAPQNSKVGQIGYRINYITPFKSDFKIHLPEKTNLKLEEVSSDLKEQYDDIYFDFSKSRKLSEEEENVLEKNMVWIFGSPRSGTSWLRNLLSAHPQNVTWNEPFIGVHFSFFKEHQRRAEYLFSYHYKNSWLPALREFILTCSYAHMQTISKTIIIKEPNGSGASDVILECLPKSKFIFLLRDGRDVVDSLIDAHKQDSWNPDLKLRRIDTHAERSSEIKRHADAWVRVTNTVWQAYENHNPKLRLLVKYEDLNKNTVEKLHKIYQFLEINISDEDVKSIVDKYAFENIPNSEKGSGKFFRSAKPGSWRQNFKEKEQELMNTIMGETLSEFDYEV